MASRNQEVLRRLKSNHYLDNIGLLFKSLYSNDNLADVTISCRDGPTIEAHKIVLSACSSYFHELLSKKTSHPVFIMHKISYQDMLYLLEFMYKGVIDVPEDSVDHLIKIAKELEITDFCLPENTQLEIDQTSHNTINTKKRKSNHIDSLSPVVLDDGKTDGLNTIPEIDVVSLNSPPPEIRKSISERSNSDVNENQTSTLSRNTRFKGKKRVPVCETIDVVDNIDISPTRSSFKKRMNNASIKSHPIQHSTPNSNSNSEALSNFVIKDVSGANGSIVLSYKNNAKNTIKSATKGPNRISTSLGPSSPKISSETTTNFTVKVAPEDILDIETVTPDITIENENHPILLDDSMTEADTSQLKLDKTDIMKQEIRPSRFKCELCKKRFYREVQLLKHRKTHTGPIRILFPCKKCDEKFSRLDKLRMHVQNYHDDDDYVPKGEKKKRLYGNPIEATPTELQQIAHNDNPTSVTQSIIQSINSITHTPKTENTSDRENDKINASNSDRDASDLIPPGKRGRGRPPKEKSLIVKPRRPKGRPRKYTSILINKTERNPVGRPRKPDSSIKPKIVGRKPGRPRKSEQSIVDENQIKPDISSIKSNNNYDGASLPYGDLSYLTTGLITQQTNHADESSTTMYENPLTDVNASTSRSSSSLSNQPPPISVTPSLSNDVTKSQPSPLLTPSNDINSLMPAIKSECNTTITPLITPPTLEPIIPFQNENITITQIPPLIYIKSPSLSAPSTSSATDTNGAINMKKIGDCTIRPVT